MKNILGLDLGTGSIGWALVREAENKDEKSSIVKLGVRVNPLTVDEKRNFENGKSITTNADRTLKRSMRRNLQRYKLRREELIRVLRANGWISEETMLAEHGNFTTFQTLRLRAKAACEEITLEELARVLLSINKKRGYKSSRKVKGGEDGQAIDGIDVARELYESGKTPGEYVYEHLTANVNYRVADFYRSDLQAEFDRIWECQKNYYPEILTDELKEDLRSKNKNQTWAICKEPFGIECIKRIIKKKEQVKENYQWRADALKKQMDLEALAVVLQEINAQIKGSSGSLGDISDRSKELYFNKQTVGQYQMARLDENPNYSLKNQVFYRQDYMDEFETIWECQAMFHPELTPELKHELRDIVIFYQRPLKSQKGLVSICELEGRKIEIEKDGRTCVKEVGPKVCPKSSPLFQEFKIWQILNNLVIKNKNDKHSDVRSLFEDENCKSGFLDQESKEMLFRELSWKDKISKADALKLLFGNDTRELELNYKEIEGNRTNAVLLKAYGKIVELSGHGEYDFSKKTSKEALEIVEDVFAGLGYNTDILHFDASLEGKAFEEQPMFRLWHLLYSYEGDNSKTGNEKLIEKISDLCGFEREYAKIVADVSFGPDYGSLSSRAIRKILPYMKEGNTYSLACEYAGYRHSKRSLTKEELDVKEYKDRLEILPKNSLRNPVVEKILNQMVNVVNSVIDEYGKPDEIRIELARELKKSAKEREEMTQAISKASTKHDKLRKELMEEFGRENPSRNDIIRYKLYNELAANGYKTLYTGTCIHKDKLFSKEYDIEHIIPQSRRFDDSFANKTLEVRAVNIEKGNKTALDYVKEKYGEDGVSAYRGKIEKLCKDGKISKTKCRNLLMSESEIPDGFIDRDLRDSQYIAKKAREILEEIVRDIVPTTGAVTDRLREDWQLIDVMQELNWNKYDRLGLTYSYQDKDGRTVRKIKDWTKRNDHRHHAMDALTVAFTKRSFIQYLNNLNARIAKTADDKVIDLGSYTLFDIPKSEVSYVVRAIENSQLYRDRKGKLRFCPPMPLDEFRAEAKRQLENVLVSIKSKNKVVTRNVNTTKRKGGTNSKVQLTPRGQLHNETVYGSIRQYVTKEEKVGTTFNSEKIAQVACKAYRIALMQRLEAFGNDPKKAFTGKNSLDKNPVFLDGLHTCEVPSKVKTVILETIYTVRKPVGPKLNVDKVIDPKVKAILKARLVEYGNDPQKAFSNLDDSPIWLNWEKGISIKRVTIREVMNNAEPLHEKKDHNGKVMLNENGEMIPADFVNTGNNHHVAIYMDADGNLQEQVVPFYEAIARVNIGAPVVDTEYRKDEGWRFLFTMKQNEYFVFPNADTGFAPIDIDLMNPDNYSLISPNLFRVQKLSKRDYMFRHHLDTKGDDTSTTLKGITWKRILSPNNLNGIVKVRINHIGQIVHVGE